MTQVDPSGRERIEGADAVNFLKKSGLDTTMLKTIWDISTPNGEAFLDR
jgi:epidermal growth factor receptor substrate 15